MVDQPTVARWAEDYRRAWEERDSAAAASLFTEDATYRSDIYEAPHEGRDGVDGYWSGVTATQGDVVVRMGSPLVVGDRADVEFWTTMTVAGEPVTLAGCLILDFDASGRCRALREYWNFTAGTNEPPPGWGE
jgi:ketosteroid isomerase-like protein